MDTVAGTALDAFVHHGLPWMGKKAVEMGRYYGSKALRNPKLQKKAIDYALDKLNPMIQLLTNYQPKYDQRKTTKQTGKILMEVLWIFTRPLENYQEPQADGPYQGINIQVLIII